MSINTGIILYFFNFIRIFAVYKHPALSRENIIGILIV